MSFLNYQYYDTPEGQDVAKKTIYLTKYAAMAGLGASAFDVLLYSHPKGILATVGRVAFFTGPLMGMAAGFAVTSNVAQNVRGKNDKLNAFLGGAVSGAVFGAWNRSLTIGVPTAIIFGAAAVVHKEAIDSGYSFFTPLPLEKESARSARSDWTLAKDIPELKNWTKG